MRKIKLLLGINNFAREGAGRLFSNQLNYLNKNKYEIALLTFSEVSDKETFFDLLPPEVKTYRLNFKNFRDIRNWFNTYKILRNYKPDVVLSQLFFSNTVLRVLRPFFGYKIIIYEQNTYINKTKLQILADKILSYLTYKIVAVSETVKNFTANQEKISRDKFAVIPNGPDCDKIRAEVAGYDREALKQKLGFNKEGKFIINVAKLHPQKNQKLLIDSFAEFVKKNSGYKLIILGEGPLRSFLEGHIKNLNLEEKVFLPGQRKNVFEYLFISDFFVLTSRYEGLSFACLEAMAAGLPVVSTNVAGSDQFIADGFNGYLVGKEDKNDVAEKMQEIADRGRDYFSENCKNTAQKYDIKENIKKLEALL